MEEIGKIYGGFILEGIAVISLMLFLWCGISVGGDNKSILRIMGENMIIEEANYDLYSDFRSVYDKESRKTAPIIKYAAGALDTGIVNLAETIKASDYKGDELAIKVLSVRMDQSQIINSVMNMKVFVAVSGGKKVLYKRVPSNNSICVNKPELKDGMIPVYYDKDVWKIADYTNDEVEWYNYGKSKWANAVFVSSDKYSDSEIGTVVKTEDILGYYVWIPRFKYKLWNNGIETTDSYNAYGNGIDIVFESGENSSGEVTCNSDGCVGRKNKYLTHPAFANGIRGFWVSKYEISDGNKFIPNVESLKNESLDSYKNIMSGLSEVYNLSNKIDTHIVCNLHPISEGEH